MKNILRFSSFSALMLTLVGCSLHDVNFSPAPSITAPDQYSLAFHGSDNEKLASLWWQEFEKPELNTLIEQSFEANQGIVQAIARIDQARALTKQTRAGLFPQIDLEGDIQDSRQGSHDQRSTREIGAALSWEIDVFNRIGAAAKADEYEAIAIEYDLAALRLSLSAEVANAYFGAVAARNRLALLNDQLKTDNELLGLIDLRLDNGVGTNVEVLQQKSQVAESKSLIPPAESDLRVYENRLDVLLGRAPDGQDRVSDEETLEFAEQLPIVGIPADLLLNRPDLKAAKASLIAADADIGSAIAERLPQISLDGSYLYSDSASFTGPVGMILGGFVQPLLDWGQRKAEVERNKAVYTEQLAAFTQAYLEAIEDVENALYQERKQREYIERLEERRKILQDTVNETEALFTQGVEDYLPVLNALQDLRNVERNIVQERLNLINFRVALHRALGGSTQSNSVQLNEG